jgi:hypothetical protein
MPIKTGRRSCQQHRWRRTNQLGGAAMAASLKENAMKANIGSVDRALRILVGLVLVGLAATGTVGWWGWLGLVPLATGLVGWCPPYAMLGISTCRTKS